MEGALDNFAYLPDEDKSRAKHKLNSNPVILKSLDSGYDVPIDDGGYGHTNSGFQYDVDGASSCSPSHVQCEYIVEFHGDYSYDNENTLKVPQTPMSAERNHLSPS